MVLQPSRFGRRAAFILTAVSAGVVGVARAFSNSYVLYVVLEFLEATVGAGVYSTGFILGRSDQRHNHYRLHSFVGTYSFHQYKR